ncbi:hypothetical protein D3C73_1337020 [compost metagenome]
MRFFFAAHGERLALGFVPAPRLLHNFSALVQNLALAKLFILQSANHAAERVHILELGPCTELLLPLRPQADVGVATH